jgi:hypothetical protein
MSAPRRLPRHRRPAAPRRATRAMHERPLERLDQQNSGVGRSLRARRPAARSKSARPGARCNTGTAAAAAAASRLALPPPPPPARSVLLGCLRSSGWGARADLSPLCVQLTGADDEPLPDPSHARRGDRLGCARCAPPPRPLPRLPSACSSLLRLCSVRRSKRQPQLRRFTSVLTRCCAACAQGKVLVGRRPMAAPVMR